MWSVTIGDLGCLLGFPHSVERGDTHPGRPLGLWELLVELEARVRLLGQQSHMVPVFHVCLRHFAFSLHVIQTSGFIIAAREIQNTAPLPIHTNGPQWIFYQKKSCWSLVLEPDQYVEWKIWSWIGEGGVCGFVVQMLVSTMDMRSPYAILKI